ncbi:hypothetical protein Neosp_002986 [[Neocosmospora] mangrovei]
MTSVTLQTPITGKYEQPTGFNEEVITSVYEATEADVEIAVDAARKAFEGAWKDVIPEERGRCLVKLADLLEEHSDTFAAIEPLDNGKPFKLAKGDLAFAFAASTLRYYGGWADKIEGKVIDTNRQSFNCSKRQPAGFPPGTINIISGFGKVAGAAISRHIGIEKVAFTGSTVVRREILQATTKSNLKKVTLELGGKSPNITDSGIFANAGQAYSAGSRIYVQEGIYDKFIEAFKQKALAIKVSKLYYNYIIGYIESGKAEGAKTEVGGERYGDKGYFIKPTIFSNVTPDIKIMKEEMFGPVCSIASVKNIKEAIKIGNDTSYGLTAAVHTTNLETAIEVSDGLRSGTVWDASPDPLWGFQGEWHRSWVGRGYAQ